MSHRTLEIIIEQTAHAVMALQKDEPVYCVARVLSGRENNVNAKGSSYVLTVVDSSQPATLAVPETACFPVPPSLNSREALLAVPLAAALRVWDRLQLELGEVAVYTEGSDFADLIGQVGGWQGGLPVIRLNHNPVGASADRGECLSISDPDEALRRLQARIKDKPGFAAVDLSGRPEIIDLLLEVMPRWGRLLLAGKAQQSLTVDFYNNVHRKGVSLFCEVFEPVSILEKKWKEPYLTAACRLLEKKDIVASCSRVVRVQEPV